MGTQIFIVSTGSVATRLSPVMIEKAYGQFDTVKFHPTESAIPFFVEGIFHSFPELLNHAPTRKIVSEIRERIDRGDYFLHAQIGTWLQAVRDVPPEGMGNKRRNQLFRLIDSYENGSECESIWSREKGNVKHINIARSNAAMLIAPATANTIAKIVNGTTDGFALQVTRAIHHSWDCPVFIAPAMNTEMLLDPFTRKNLAALEQGGPKYRLLPTETKMLQCGESGDGAMLGIDEIFKRIAERLEEIFGNPFPTGGQRRPRTF